MLEYRIYPDQIFGHLDYDSFEQVLAVNTVAPLKMAEAFYPHIKSNLKKIVSVSSNEGSIGGAYDDESGQVFLSI